MEKTHLCLYKLSFSEGEFLLASLGVGGHRRWVVIEQRDENS